MIINPELLSAKCRKCEEQCGGLAKRALTVENLRHVPAKCFIGEVDLEEGDKQLISNHRREGWQIAMIDCLTESELTCLYETIGRKKSIHYSTNQNPWLKRTAELYEWKHQRKPDANEFDAAYGLNKERYRLAYTLLFPEHIIINDTAKPKNIDTFREFLTQADRVAAENILKYKEDGACPSFRIRMSDAETLKVSCNLSYVRAVFDPVSYALEPTLEYLHKRIPEAIQTLIQK